MSDSKQNTPEAQPMLKRISQDLRYRIWFVYRRIFSLVWLANIAVLIAFFLVPIDRTWLTTIALVNLTISIVIRQDFIINLIFTLCCAYTTLEESIQAVQPQLFVGLLAHSPIASGTGYSPSLHVSSVATIVLSGIALAMLIGMVLSAYPTLRKLYHDTFEAVHRFFGWSVLILVWVQVMLTVRDNKPPHQSLGEAVVCSPELWLLITITTSIATSWTLLKKVPVDSEVLSDHALRLHFQYTNAIRGSFIRLSERPLLEWHSFATIPIATNEDQKRGCSVIVSRAGDWTSRQISKPPTRIWVRGIPTMGVMRVASLFRSVVLIGTGSGIGPLLGHVPPCRLRLIWSAPSPLKTFGHGILDSVYKADPEAVVWDTRENGRPSLVEIACHAMQEIDAEAVIIISNETVTRIVVGVMERKGVPAFGAIWDS
ncbi:hypothetical protein N7522_001758 [Penicillium canescens]|nr:uncharacterized protein N7446_008631 [Penicillium canescens]KAJ6019691.1 hypothetical protein N7522_001758 [Penicillium canescens]KAJ6033073.1 hypothetical protein N7444_010844 [Penicillium canescens]KAJ6059048.1 hypothetical protein N7446_008631 [Penicillium canescens]KAJ6170009.1 hypothetical protein N7485_007355 [Penicillium canescens]